MIVATLTLLCGLALGPVVLRSGGTIAAELVEGVSAQGVLVRPAFDGGDVPIVSLVPWAEVLDIEGGWGEGEPYRGLADAVDRAERRLTRGDVSGARELLEPLAGEYLARSGPTSGAIASALAICRVLRSDPSGAADAWLAWRASPLGPVRSWIDPETSLAPSIPPIFTPREARSFIAAHADRAGAPEHANELRAMYLAAARAALGDRPEDLQGPETRLRADAGVRLVWEVVRSGADPDVSGRRSARDALRRRTRTPGPAWQDAWCRLAIGTSMMSEPDRMESDAGAAELVGVVLGDQHTAPGLAELAAELLIGYFDATDRPGHADAVRSMDRAAMSGLIPGANNAQGPTPDDPDSPPGTETGSKDSP